MVDCSRVPMPEDLALLVPARGLRNTYLTELHGAPMLCAMVGPVRCILSIDHADGREWFHVSASGPGPRGKPRLPTWAELAQVRAALFKPDAVVVQVFPPEAEWYTAAEVLHLWQRIGADRLIPDLRKEGAL